MNVMAAMEETMVYADIHHWSNAPTIKNPSMSYEHLKDMQQKMRTMPMSEGKQNRWLGWMQATICSWGVATMEQMKEINKKHSTDEPKQIIVVCVNDFPDGAFTSQQLADEYIERQKKLNRPSGGRPMYYHTHDFIQNKGSHE